MLRYYITSRAQAGGILPLLGFVERALAGGVDYLQIRERDLPARELAALTRRVLKLPNPHRARILVNERSDVALAVGAHGVHLRSNSLAPDTIRSIAPPDFVIGVSCHSVEDVSRAARLRADFAVLGPIFEPASKAVYGPPLGIEVLRQAAEVSSIPVLAVGGIDENRAKLCQTAGAAGFAAITFFQLAASSNKVFDGGLGLPSSRA